MWSPRDEAAIFQRATKVETFFSLMVSSIAFIIAEKSERVKSLEAEAFLQSMVMMSALWKTYSVSIRVIVLIS